MSLERMFETVEKLRETALADAAFGEPREAGDRVLIPVACVGTGFGMGFGRDVSPAEEGEAEAHELEDEGGGGGGGARSRPVAVIEVTAEEVVVKPIVDETKVALAGMALVGWVVFWVLATGRAAFRK